MIALSAIRIPSGQTSVQHFVHLGKPGIGAYRDRTGDLRLAKPENFRLTMRVYEPAGQLAGQTLWE